MGTAVETLTRGSGNGGIGGNGHVKPEDSSGLSVEIARPPEDIYTMDTEEENMPMWLASKEIDRLIDRLKLLWFDKNNESFKGSYEGDCEDRSYVAQWMNKSNGEGELAARVSFRAIVGPNDYFRTHLIVSSINESYREDVIGALWEYPEIAEKMVSRTNKPLPRPLQPPQPATLLTRAA